MILETLRKIFGCYSDQIPAIIYLDEQAEEHTQYVEEPEKKDEQAEIIKQLMAEVLAEKRKGFISWTEDAMDSVTENQFKFIKYRNPCPYYLETLNNGSRKSHK